MPNQPWEGGGQEVSQNVGTKVGTNPTPGAVGIQVSTNSTSWGTHIDYQSALGIKLMSNSIDFL